MEDYRLGTCKMELHRGSVSVPTSPLQKEAGQPVLADEWSKNVASGLGKWLENLNISNRNTDFLEFGSSA
jgi:hypothetical protein